MLKLKAVHLDGSITVGEITDTIRNREGVFDSFDFRVRTGDSFFWVSVADCQKLIITRKDDKNANTGVTSADEAD